MIIETNTGQYTPIGNIYLQLYGRSTSAGMAKLNADV